MKSCLISKVSEIRQKKNQNLCLLSDIERVPLLDGKSGRENAFDHDPVSGHCPVALVYFTIP